MKHFFQNRSHHEFSFFEPVVLMYINPINSKKCGTTFSQIFRFWFIDFSKKIFEIFFDPWGLLQGYVDLCKMLQVKINNFWSRSRFLQTWNLFTWDTVSVYRYPQLSIYRYPQLSIFKCYWSSEKQRKGSANRKRNRMSRYII